MPEVTLTGGPADGAVVEVGDARSGLQVTGHGVPEGTVATYRPTRTKGVFRYRGMAKIIATIPMPEAPAESGGAS